MRRESEITQNTKVSIAMLIPAVGLGMTILSIVVSVSVTDARMEAQVASQEKRLDVRIDEMTRMQSQITEIDKRTARMEGILEELRRTQ